MGDRPAQDQPQNDVYTVLVIVGTLVMASATIFLAVRSQHLFGSWNPFSGA